MPRQQKNPEHPRGPSLPLKSVRRSTPEEVGRSCRDPAVGGKMPAENGALIEADLLERIRQLELFSRFRVEGALAGLHTSPFKGFSTDFLQHRQYFRGDHLKHIDWRVFARTGRYYVRQYEELCHARISVLLDTSASMAYRAPDAAYSKHEVAVRCAALLCSLALMHGDSVALTCFDTQVRVRTPYGKSRPHLHRILRILAESAPCGGTDFPAALREATAPIRHKGLTIVLSDCMDAPEQLIRQVSRLRFDGSDVILMQIFDPFERELDFDSVTQFHDLESEEIMVVDPLIMRKDYQREFDAHQADMKSACRRHGFDHMLLPIGDPYEVALFEYLRGRMEWRV